MGLHQLIPKGGSMMVRVAGLLLVLAGLSLQYNTYYGYTDQELEAFISNTEEGMVVEELMYNGDSCHCRVPDNSTTTTTTTTTTPTTTTTTTTTTTPGDGSTISADLTFDAGNRIGLPSVAAH